MRRQYEAKLNGLTPFQISAIASDPRAGESLWISPVDHSPDDDFL